MAQNQSKNLSSNRMAKLLRTPRFRQLVIKNKKTYNRKKNKDGRILFDEEGNPIPVDKGIIEKGLDFISPTIREGIDFVTDPLNVGSLPNNLPQPVVQTAEVKDPNTNLTRTQQALLSPEEQVIASRRT